PRSAFCVALENREVPSDPRLMSAPVREPFLTSLPVMSAFAPTVPQVTALAMRTAAMAGIAFFMGLHPYGQERSASAKQGIPSGGGGTVASPGWALAPGRRG